jgi:transmembrane sensor
MVGGLVMSPAIASPGDQVLAEATAWLVRLQNDARSAADVAAFQAWVAADSSHGVAFEAVSGTWDITGGIPRDMRGQKRAHPVVSRRRALVAAGGAAVAVGAGITYWRETSAGAYQTEVGEQKHITLRDGSRIFLDTNSRVDVDFGRTSRSAELPYGRANFRLVADPWRPFIVSTSSSRIVAVASALDIRRDGEQVSVLVIQGAAEIQRPNFPVTKLLKGERFMAVANGEGQLDRPNLIPLLAWQTGQAIFENGRLSDAVAEMNRYSTTKLAIADGGTAELRVSGIYSVGDNLSFANSVSRLLPVKIVQEDGRIDILPDRARQMRG